MNKHSIQPKDIGAEEGSQHLEEARKDFDIAKEALERSDAEQLFHLYEKAIKQQGATMDTMLRAIDMYRKDAAPVRSMPVDVIAAMERIAMAALSLARDIAVPSRKKE